MSAEINDNIQSEMHQFLYHEVPKGFIKDPDGALLNEYKAKAVTWCNNMTGKLNAQKILYSIEQCNNVNRLIQIIAQIEMKNAGIGVI